MTKDFTLDKYKQLCETILANDFTVLTVREYLRQDARKPLVVLRHDVDRKPINALKMARLEHQLGIQATYYFRFTPNVFRPDIIQEISALNHEIGYHYETLSKCRGNMRAAIALFKRELEELRKHTPISTISMHGRPFSKWDNRDLWHHYNFIQFDLTGECYVSIDYNKVIYLSDTGRTWHPGRYNIRDRVTGYSPEQLETTDHLIHYISTFRQEALCLLTHPNRWTDSNMEWLAEAATDYCINKAKQILVLIRSSNQ